MKIFKLVVIYTLYVPYLLAQTVTDVEGNSYKTVVIGNQTWMAENLRTTKYNNGVSLNLLADSAKWINPYRIDGYCWYNNDESNKTKYGALYNWEVVGKGNICPFGWHVPSEQDWIYLIMQLGGYDEVAVKLKATGSEHWTNRTLEITNESGFTALPAGGRLDSYFENEGNYAYFWSRTKKWMDGWAYPIAFELSDYSNSFYGTTFFSSYGCSIRCIKDN